ncbi:MAG: CFI-box-CTERM domain-containing protein [Cytophagales bacterium]|nr:CFI-box-CTERM domain-containing protein [Cytophagales bacterium]
MKTTQIGGLVSLNYFQNHYKSFKTKFQLPSEVSIDRQALERTLNASDLVKGIRFTFGLDDPQNINSLRVILVPCSSRYEDDPRNHPIISSHSYLDHRSESHNIYDVCRMISNYVSLINSQRPDWPYKEVTRGAFFGKDSIAQFVKSINNEDVSLYLGFNDANGFIVPILGPTDDLNGPFMNIGTPCPDVCLDEGETTDNPCPVSIAVIRCAEENQLDIHRQFRDQYLLTAEDGGTYYELYYFISPMIAHVLSAQENTTEKLEFIYNEKVVPFTQLVQKQKNEEAFEFLKETLRSWVLQYEFNSAHR